VFLIIHTLVLQLKCVLIFCSAMVRNISYSRKNSVRYFHYIFTWNARYYCQILADVYFSQPNFEKSLRYQISWNSFHLEPSFTIRMDRCNETNSHILQCLQRA
jgi:hypothetical protein